MSDFSLSLLQLRNKRTQLFLNNPVKKNFLCVPAQYIKDNEEINFYLQLIDRTLLQQNIENYKFEKSTYRVQRFRSAQMYVKEACISSQKVRIICFPIKQYPIKQIKQVKSSFLQMIDEFSLLSTFLSLQEDNNSKLALKLLFFSDMLQGNTVGKGQNKRKVFKIDQFINQSFQFLKNKFNIEIQQIKSGISFILKAQAQSNKINIEQARSQEQYNAFIVSNDYSIFKVKREKQTSSLSPFDGNFVQHGNFITMSKMHKFLFYNRFTTNQLTKQIQLTEFKDTKKNADINSPYKTLMGQIAKQKFDQQFVDKIFQPIYFVTLNPLISVVEKIYKQNKFAVDTKNLYEKINDNSYDSFKSFNKRFGQQEWSNSIKNAQEQGFIRQTINQKGASSDSLLNKYTQQFSQLQRFVGQDANFVYATGLHFINKLSPQIQKIKSNIQTNKKEQIKEQKKILQISIIIIRLLKNLQYHDCFKQLLLGFNAQFYEFIVNVLIKHYELIMRAYGFGFGKIPNISSKINKINTTNINFRTILMQVQDLKQPLIPKNNNTNAFLLQKQQMLDMHIYLLHTNKAKEKNINYEIKLFRGKYDQAIVKLQLAIRKAANQNQQNVNQKRLKQALKIFYQDIYHFIFNNEQNKKQYGQKLKNNFTQRQLLQNISRTLKCLNKIQLCIQIQKKLGFVLNVQTYYNRWMYEFQRFNEELIAILKDAIQYFQTKCQFDKVLHYYNRLILNSRQQKEIIRLEGQRNEFILNIRSQSYVKKIIEGAKNKKFDIKPEIKQKIMNIYAK